MAISGITINLISFIDTGEQDEFNRPILGRRIETVDNVLVSPVSSEDVINELNLSGKRAVYELAIPKGDAHTWTGSIVELFGEEYRVIGEPVRGIESMIPLSWNAKVKVEKYE